MLQSILIPFTTVFLAEFFDKSQLALFLLSTKTRNHVMLFIGALLAFVIVDGIAILLGSFLIQYVPHIAIKIGASLLFLYFGIKTLREKEKKQNIKTSGKNALASGFMAVFLSEWGDKTQIASAVFATQFPPLLVFFSVFLAMTILTFLAVFVGRFIGKKVSTRPIHIIAGVLFLLLGVGFLLS